MDRLAHTQGPVSPPHFSLSQSGLGASEWYYWLSHLRAVTVNMDHHTLKEMITFTEQPCEAGSTTIWTNSLPHASCTPL